LDRQGLLRRISREKRHAISPIIATLILILIAIAAGVLVYAYVVGFIGSNTTNNGGGTSIIQVTNFCVSASTNCNGGSVYIAISNQGSVAVSVSSSNPVELYFNDVTKGTTYSVACYSGAPTAVLAGGLNPGQTYSCSISASGYLLAANQLNGAAGDTIKLTVVNPDSGSAASSVKAIN
jgi:flagellin-like protein